jgi:hypothetical protein
VGKAVNCQDCISFNEECFVYEEDYELPCKFFLPIEGRNHEEEKTETIPNQN